ncbi:hydroxymethylglutaryl-CoA reductase, degradative [Flavobacteriaceae bacterium]|nr:hydroxymethylglutaryl-CoA reductase, degradative [Flavobacteriaceae bacterium]
MPNKIIGFSKLSRAEKIDWLKKNILDNSHQVKLILDKYLNSNKDIQAIHDSFSENSISNFYLPYSVSPNFLINDKIYTIPLVTEESSVVAALSNAAKFWFDKGGFKTEVKSFTKKGQIHFSFDGDKNILEEFIKINKKEILKSTDIIAKNMKKRGGGISSIKLIDKTGELKNYFQLSVDFNTSDSMGANFINSCLESMSKKIKELSDEYFKKNDFGINIIMSILSNYTPDCIVESYAECDINDLVDIANIEPKEFAEKMKYAFDIAKIDISRAVTHNKGIMNGIDAILIATGNDFRAVEAGIHAYASSNSKYQSLSECSISGNKFRLSLKIPLSVGTVGGITDLHPLVKLSLQILDNPSSKDLMCIIASVGLAQNFAAVKSLITSGIQEGHMKMHLINLLIKNNASEEQIRKAKTYFFNKEINSSSVNQFLKLNK